MVRKLYRIHLFYVVLLALVILLAGYTHEQPAQTSKQPALTAALTHTTTQTNTVFTPSGRADTHMENETSEFLLAKMGGLEDACQQRRFF